MIKYGDFKREIQEIRIQFELYKLLYDVWDLIEIWGAFQLPKGLRALGRNEKGWNWKKLACNRWQRR